MKIIKNNAIISVIASSSDATHPASNLLNSSPKKKWKAASSAVTMASLDVVVRGTTGGLGMVGIVAESAFVTISDPTGITWGNVAWGNVSWESSLPDFEVEQTWVENEDDDFATLWVSFEQFVAAVTITIELRKTSGTPTTLAAGVLIVGEMIDIPGVQYPIQEGLKDYSITRELSNGAFDYIPRDIVRTFSGTINVNRAAYFYRFMRDIARSYGMEPTMILLVDNMGSGWVVFARFAVLPSGSHNTHTRSLINFDILEVI